MSAEQDGVGNTLTIMAKVPPPEAAKDPTVALMFALNNLHTLAFNVGMLRQVSEDRRKRLDADMGYRTLRNKFVAQDTPVLEGLAKIRAMDEQDARERKPAHEPLVRHIRDGLIKPWRKEIEKARAAMEAGGARTIDLALNPGSHTHRIQLGEHLQDADSTLLKVEIMLGMPNATFFDEAEALGRHGEWFRQFHRRISEANGALRTKRSRRVRETVSGGRAKAVRTKGHARSETVFGSIAPDMRSVAWFRQVLEAKVFGPGKAGNTSIQLRRMAGQPFFPKSACQRVGKANRRRYSVDAVCKSPEFATYSVHFRTAFAENFVESRRRGTQGA